ncbi:hypothetical protein HYFRA_00002626 [Hymenoscyphus fraxineus]|uniref:Heterokaryon incompatibility domain-containing protein n=1 Tax=Hymenoscyphus fraxineus TaxID=746836 RepID=A0A9N9PNP4_9HELO|nr:hypothetical protein HYFRA_00002626 [Hymenoscyphus fraxineus]
MNPTTSPNERTFHYSESLNGKEIRLIEITEPDSLLPPDSDPLKLRIFKAPMPGSNEAKDTEQESITPRYLALSYTWGPPQPSHTISINNAPFKIGKSLFEALSQLRSTIDLPIWIDAICIDQMNTAEKGPQLGKMYDIYSHAERTIIWLGSGKPSTPVLFERLERLGNDAIRAGIWDLQERDFKIWHDRGDPRTTEIKSQLESLMMSSRNADPPFPLDALFDLSHEVPWFRRVWILQELSAAKDYEFMYGSSTIPGDFFIAGYFFVTIWEGIELQSMTGNGPLPQNGLSFAQTIFQRLMRKDENGNDLPISLSSRAATTLGTRRRHQRKGGLTLMGHLNRAFTLTSDAAIGATMEKDRIYGILGLASDKETLGIQYDCRSETTFQEVYADVAKKLAMNGNLDILTLCRAGFSREYPYEQTTRDPNLPSWAPDWIKPIRRPWGGAKEDSLFQAGGKEFALDRQLNESNSQALIVETRVVEIVTEVGTIWSPQWEKPFDNGAAKTLFSELESFLSKSGDRYTAQQREDAKWRIPIGDQEFDSLGMARRATHVSCAGYQNLKSYVSLDASNVPLEGEGSISYLSTMKDMHDSRPFLSDIGGVGLCPGACRPGDEIHIVLGLHVPIVVRRAEGKAGCCTLIGEAFAYGTMDGEELEKASANNLLKLI